MNKNLKIFMTLKKAWMMSAILLILAVGYHKERDASKDALTYVMFISAFIVPMLTIIKGKMYCQNDKALVTEWLKINGILSAILLGSTIWGFMIFSNKDIIIDNNLLIIYSVGNLILVFTSSLLYAMMQVKFNNKYAMINNASVSGETNE